MIELEIEIDIEIEIEIKIEIELKRMSHKLDSPTAYLQTDVLLIHYAW